MPERGMRGPSEGPGRATAACRRGRQWVQILETVKVTSRSDPGMLDGVHAAMGGHQFAQMTMMMAVIAVPRGICPTASDLGWETAIETTMRHDKKRTTTAFRGDAMTAMTGPSVDGRPTRPLRRLVLLRRSIETSCRTRGGCADDATTRGLPYALDRDHPAVRDLPHAPIRDRPAIQGVF